MICLPIPDATIVARRAAIVRELRGLVAAGNVIEDDTRLAAYESDALTAYRQRPLAVVLPESVAEVAAILAFAHREGVNVVPRGAGTSLSGGAIPAAVLIVPRRNQGPIIVFNQAAGTAISVQYAGFSGTREMQAFRSINRAGNLNQFIAALQSFDVGSQNFIYADTEGNIAYFAAGEMPLREDLENGAPVGLPPFLIRVGQGGNEWLPAQGNDPNRALPFAILPFS